MGKKENSSEKIVYEHLILLTMMEFGGLTLEESRRLVDDSEILSQNYESRLFHDEPYYWGISLWFGLENIEWYQMDEYWPIPLKYRELVKKYHKGKTIFHPPQDKLE